MIFSKDLKIYNVEIIDKESFLNNALIKIQGIILKEISDGNDVNTVAISFKVENDCIENCIDIIIPRWLEDSCNNFSDIVVELETILISYGYNVEYKKDREPDFIDFYDTVEYGDYFSYNYITFKEYSHKCLMVLKW